LAALFRVLSDPTRLKLVSLLGGGERNVGDLCGALGQPQPTVSHHLRILRSHSILTTRRDGKHVYYALEECRNGRAHAGEGEILHVPPRSLMVHVGRAEGDREVGTITSGPESPHTFANVKVVPAALHPVH
jgi:DNA-binding transcriptional ArsR family regulator